jgi:hypothetical protein
LVGVFVALLTSDRLPLTLPATAGANFTEKDALCPAASVTGSAGPLTLNPVPVVVACEIVTLAVFAVTVTFCVLLLPTVTEPKLAANVPMAAAPVPANGTVVVGFEALLTNEKLPVMPPAAVGANFTVKDALCPAASVTGNAGPLTLNPLPVAVALEIVTLAVPAVTETVCELLLPTVTLPKLSEVGLADSVPDGLTAIPDS